MAPKDSGFSRRYAPPHCLTELDGFLRGACGFVAIAVEITDFKAFWPAEDYHQDYYRTHESDYKRYRKGSGRVAFLQKLWGEEAAWGHPVIEGVPDAQAPTHSESPAAPTSQPTSRPAGQ